MKKSYDISEEAFKIATLAVQAILYEASCFPSPGLVSPLSQGAHMDMNYYTFLDGTSALIKPLLLCAESGFSHCSEKEIFNKIRAIGVQGEREMLNKTLGINTQKGMLFLLGICVAGVSKALYEGKSFEDIRGIIMVMTQGIVSEELIKADRKQIGDQSHGEKVFLKYNVNGIRGEVEKGLPTAFDFSIRFYSDCMDLSTNERLVHTLIGIMQYCDDSTILYRHNIDTLIYVKRSAAHIINIGGMRTKEGRVAIKALDKEFDALRISPGGSADLLAVTLFLYKVRKEFYNYA